ncbi:hypothetical protein L1987_46016 [Smallanthus sonchifolius]|uniref:Uncharacterized protein n=1 Tax=Smallanthus sonchifolius TaxID=185202 RepID=A0ACB9FYF2_9ASTR|nr:hypothetical protein L1987_46016 [Smallanthus sonchifolius]
MPSIESEEREDGKSKRREVAFPAKAKEHVTIERCTSSTSVLQMANYAMEVLNGSFYRLKLSSKDQTWDRNSFPLVFYVAVPLLRFRATDRLSNGMLSNVGVKGVGSIPLAFHFQ